MSSQGQNLFRVGVAQLTSTDDFRANLEVVLSCMREASDQGAQLLAFPENCLYMRLKSGEPLVPFHLSSDESGQVAQLAKQKGLHVLLTTPVAKEAGRISNATIYYSPLGEKRVVYEKIHLFDVDVENAPPVRESNDFAAGREPALIEVAGWKLGLSICYDIRFAELYSQYRDQVDIIFIPAAFLVPTGRAHWQVMNRARAIENQCYVVSPCQSGEHIGAGGVKRLTYGHSLVVSPWGEILLDAENKTGVFTLDLDRARIEKARRQIPMGQHRRL
ncbi:MAG: carbon-nitrogen hydrolase family protein [Bdellovibrionales bacterium]